MEVLTVFTDGGDASAKEGWRIAVSIDLRNTGDRRKGCDTVQKLGLCTEQEAKVLFTMAQRKINAVTSTSAGRLFDGVSAILGIRRASTFEGEASMALEFAAEAWRAQEIQKKNVDTVSGERTDIKRNVETTGADEKPETGNGRLF